jgi:predicted Zn-dependent protease
LKELQNGMPAKDFRETINTNFKESLNSINELIEITNSCKKIQIIATNDIEKMQFELDNIKNKIINSQNTQKDLYKYIDIVESNINLKIQGIDFELKELQKPKFWQFWKGK